MSEEILCACTDVCLPSADWSVTQDSPCGEMTHEFDRTHIERSQP